MATVPHGKLEKIHGHAVGIDGSVRVALETLEQWVDPRHPPELQTYLHNADYHSRIIQQNSRALVRISSRMIERRYRFPDGQRPRGYINRVERQEIAELVPLAQRTLESCKEFMKCVGRIARGIPNSSEQALEQRRDLNRRYRNKITWPANRVVNLAVMMSNVASGMTDYDPRRYINSIDYDDDVDSDPDNNFSYDSGAD